MPFPALLLIIGEALLFGLATGTAVGLGVLVVTTLYESLRGKTVAVIGERSAGKTTLSTFLSNGTIPEKYEQTLSERRLDGRTINLAELNLTIAEINDVPGDKEFYNKWKEAVVRSDVVYILSRADKLVSSETARKRTLADVRHVCGWIAEHPGKKVFFVGTHCDLIPEYVALGPDKRGDFQDSFFRTEELREVALRLREAKAALILGSLKDQRSIQQVVHRSFQHIVEAKQ